MQRKPTKNTRGPNADEKAFQSYIKEHFCIWCGNDGPSIVDHVKGATFKHNKTLIGHWFVLPNCQSCDYKKTVEGKKLGDYTKAWEMVVRHYPDPMKIPVAVEAAIGDWGGSWQNGRV